MLSAFVTTAVEEEAAPSLLLPLWPDLLWGTIAFAIILVFFMWKVMPRLNAALDARADAISGGIKRAEEAQAEAQAALEQYNAQLREARTEAASIRDAARDDAKRIRTELVGEAQAEAARVVANAQAQIEAERQSALVSLRTQVGAMAIDLASGVIGESLNDKRSNDIVDRFLADLEASEAAAAKAKG
ncbi:MAG: F0F1 ATP synthase subunit B [Rhodoglobus sp.]